MEVKKLFSKKKRIVNQAFLAQKAVMEKVYEAYARGIDVANDVFNSSNVMFNNGVLVVLTKRQGKEDLWHFVKKDEKGNLTYLLSWDEEKWNIASFGLDTYTVVYDGVRMDDYRDFWNLPKRHQDSLLEEINTYKKAFIAEKSKGDETVK